MTAIASGLMGARTLLRAIRHELPATLSRIVLTETGGLVVAVGTRAEIAANTFLQVLLEEADLPRTAEDLAEEIVAAYRVTRAPKGAPS